MTRTHNGFCGNKREGILVNFMISPILPCSSGENNRLKNQKTINTSSRKSNKYYFYQIID